VTALRERATALVSELLSRLGPDLQELEFRRDDLRVRVSRIAVSGGVVPPTSSPAPSGSGVMAPAAPKAPSGAVVTAPLTGVFYRSASPQSPAFIQVGGVVAAGDVIGLIEAMKLFNEIKTTSAGRVRAILAESGQLVRAHQALVELDR
jgi:acetyl-CoA carboxylase biotin carboxyl carrier protein